MPDPRKARGQRRRWPLILTLIGAALASGQRNVQAIGQWVEECAAELCALLQPPRGRLPSGATLRRALRAVDVAALEGQIAACTPAVPGPAPAAPRWAGQAVDGKAVRGANRHGARVHLVSLVRHRDAVVLGQARVTDKRNEITAVPALLAGPGAPRALTGTVTTMDALLTQRALAAQIRRQGGHDLLVVKANQPALHAAVDRLCSEAPPALPTDHLATVAAGDKGHGRLETRTLTRTAARNAYLGWPDVGQVLRRSYRAIDLATGQVRQEVTYGLLSLRPEEATPAEAAARWRGHWTIENRVHDVRDVRMGEDAGQQRRGSTPQALAALRNGVRNLLRAAGWANIAAALRHYGSYTPRALRLLGVPLDGL